MRFFLLILLISFQNLIFSNEENSSNLFFKVSNLKIKNAKWHVSSEGTPPELLSYDIEFLLDPTHSFYTALKQETFGSPLSTDIIKVGDDIQILREGFMLDKEGMSWLNIYHQQSGIKLEGTGQSIKAKTEGPEGSIKIQDVTYECGKVVFKLEDSYVEVPVDSEKYHGYYNNMPMILLGRSTTLEDEVGQYNYVFLLENPETGQEITAMSLPINERTHVSLKNIQPINAKYYSGSMTWAAWIFQWEMTFSDSSNKYISNSVWGYNNVGRYFPSDDLIKDFLSNQGKEFIIVDEKADGPRNSMFTLKSVKTKQEIQLRGPARKSR